MAKQTGLGDQLYVDGINVSGDIGSLGNIASPYETQNVTGIDKSAMERLGLLRDGTMEFVSFFNPTTDQAFDVFSTLPTTDISVAYFRGTSAGSPTASLIAKQINYDPTRADDGSITFETTIHANDFGLDWGKMLTDGIDTFASAGSGDGFDYGASIGTTNFGLQAFVHVFGIDSGSADIAIQDSDDDGAVDPYADVTGGTFTTVSAVGSERIQSGRAQAVKQWLRVDVSGTFTNLDIAVAVTKNNFSVFF